MVKNGQAVVRISSDYGQLSTEMWQFLHNIYGGGPELILKQNTPPPVSEGKVNEAGDAGVKVTEGK